LLATATDQGRNQRANANKKRPQSILLKRLSAARNSCGLKDVALERLSMMQNC
jgi:hypothetical protein